MAADLTQWDSMIEAAARRYNVDPRLVRAVMTQESGGRPNAVSPQGARGLMQLMPATAWNLAVDPDNPAQNIDGGAALLSRLLDDYGDPSLAILAYHGGPDRRQWGPRTQNYLRAVTSHYRRLSSEPVNIPGTNQAADPPVTPGEVAEIHDGEFNRPDTTQEQSVEDLMTGEGTRATAQPPETSVLGRVGAGVTRGLRDVLDAPAEVLASAAERTGLTSALQGGPLGRFMENTLDVPIPTAETLRAQNNFERGRFNQDYGDSGWANVGRVGGQVLGSAPILMSGGNLLSAAGNAARVAPATSGVANAVAPVAQTAFGSAGATTGSMAGNLLARAGGGAVAGGTSAALTLDPNRPIREQLLQGAAIGAGVNSLVAPAVQAGVGSLRNAAGPGVTPARADLARRADQLGVPVYAPQISTSPFIRTWNNLNEVVPFSGQTVRLEDQGRQWVRAVSRTFGEDTDEITRATIAGARRRIGDRLDDAAVNTQLQTGNPHVLGRLMQLRDDALNAPLETNQHQQLVRYIDRLLTELAPGQPNIPGTSYQTWTRHTSPLGSMQNSNDTTLRAFGGRIKEVLDDLLEQSSPAGQREAIRDARSQWKAMMTIEPLVQADGTMNAAALLNRVRRGYSGFEAGRGTGNALGDLADIGKTFLQRVHGSDTARNQKVSRLIGGIEGLVPAAMYMHDPMLGLAGLGAMGMSSLVGRASSAALNSQTYRNRLLNSAMNQPIPRNPLGTNVPLGRLGVPAAVATGQVSDGAAWTMPDVNVTARR